MPKTKTLLGPHSKGCPTRVLLDQLANKWAVLMLLAIAERPIRFNDLRRLVEGISQKMLSETLRRMEWNGLVRRRVVGSVPVSVEYSLTPLGKTLMPVIEGLRSWSMTNYAAVVKARTRYEAQATIGTD